MSLTVLFGLVCATGPPRVTATSALPSPSRSPPATTTPFSYPFPNGFTICPTTTSPAAAPSSTTSRPYSRLPLVAVPPRVPMAGSDPVRVLVIDDEPFVRDTLGEILRQQHHQVVVANDGVSGLARFRESRFDLVMTDLAMPGMSGWQVARAVKATRPQVPVVLVTGWGVEVPVISWPAPPQRLVRVSAQLYNERDHYVRLADALRKELADERDGATA